MSEATQSKVPHFRSQSKTTDCDGCHGKFPSGRMDHWKPAVRAGCPICSLMFHCVQKLYKYSKPDSTFISNEPHSVIGVLLVSERYKDRPMFASKKNKDFELFTIRGSKECSLPIVAVRGDLTAQLSSRYLSVLSEWLEDCTLNHPICGKTEGPLPTRVLDLGASLSEPVRLYITKKETARYLALSHCWGENSSTQIRTTKENLQSRVAGIESEEIPRSFLDAISIGRDLGIRYLWIDSLCIIQDDMLDWAIESGDMASIYNQAYLVIGAASASNSRQGFFTATTGDEGNVYVATVENDDASLSHVYARYRRPHGDLCTPLSGRSKRGPLSERCWTLQEQILSSRMVHFEQTEMFWECRTTIECECLELAKAKANATENKSGEIVTSPTAQTVKANSYKIALEREAIEKLRRTWYAALGEYHKRCLTYGADFLPALSGIVTHMQRFGAGEYLAGLWKNNLPDELLWKGSSLMVRAEPYRAPSWSWASLTEPGKNHRYPVSSLSHYSREDGSCEALCRVLDASCTPAGPDANGAVAAGAITIEGKIVPLFKSGTKGHHRFEELNRVYSLRCDKPVHIYSEVDFEPEVYDDMDLYGLLIGWAERATVSNLVIYKGLILQNVNDEEKGVYERVGVWYSDKGFRLAPSREEILTDVDVSIVTII